MPKEERTSVEKVSGNLATESALTLIGALSGNPLGSLLPVLSKSLASERQRVRIEAALLQINEDLTKQEAKLNNISDSQYKLMNETILSILITANPQKLEYLRSAVKNSLDTINLKSHESIYLSRIVRDISAEEADFLIKNFANQRLQLGYANGTAENVLTIPWGSEDELVITSLISLGLVVPAGPTFDDSGQMRFASIVAKVIALLRTPST